MTTMTRDQVLETVREAHAAGRRANLIDAILTGADLRGTNLTDADLADADLRGTNLTDADLTNADLIRADLTGATLTGADLTNADLIRAVLTGATLTGADLTGTCFGGALLTTKQLLDARGLRLGGYGLTEGTWDELLPTNPQRRQLVEHLLRDGWNGTLREAIETVEGWPDGSGGTTAGTVSP